MRHFVGWEEPKFSSPYGSRDVRTAFASIRHKYKVWKAFRDHTGHWPVFSIWFHFLSWLAVIGFAVSAFVWVVDRPRESRWIMFAVAGVLLVLLGARELCARLMRKLDWKRYGAQPS
jgi:sulfite exporter TauE/SafE